MRLFVCILSFVFLVKADISLSDLQPIAEFSDSCTEAYETSIKNCDGASFAPFSSNVACSKDCKNELNSLSAKIQQACRGDGVKPNTVIAHAFQGDLSNWLCATGAFSTSSASLKSGTATNALASKTSSSSASQSSNSSSSTEMRSSSSSQSSTSTSITSSTSSSVAASTKLSTSSTRSSAVPSSAQARPAPTRNMDSTPFDQTVAASGASRGNAKEMLLIQILIPTLSALICVMVGSLLY